MSTFVNIADRDSSASLRADYGAVKLEKDAKKDVPCGLWLRERQSGNLRTKLLLDKI
jgi:hypothetical protein